MKNNVQLSREQLKRIVGGKTSTGDVECGYQAGGATCPMNLCCSAFGYCGNTIFYCGYREADANCQCQSGPCLSTC